jgi:hypothetical protein
MGSSYLGFSVAQKKTLRFFSIRGGARGCGGGKQRMCPIEDGQGKSHDAIESLFLLFN